MPKKPVHNLDISALDAINPASFLLTVDGSDFKSPNFSTWQELAVELKKALLDSDVDAAVINLIEEDVADELVIRSIKDMLDNVVEDLRISVFE